MVISFGLLFAATTPIGINAQTNQTDIIIEKTNPPSTNDSKLRNITETTLLNITEDDPKQAKQILSEAQELVNNTGR